MLLVANGTAATRTQWVWPKSWAEKQLLKQFPATTTVCDPVGPPTRESGYNAYAVLACSVTLSGGAYYVLVIKPRSKAAWTTLSIERFARQPDAGAVPASGGATSGSSRPKVPSSHRLTAKSLDGSQLTFDDGSRWLVSPIGQLHTVLWHANDEIAVTQGTERGYPYQLVDTSNGSSAPARFSAD
jgi:hypothetical protein